MPSARVFGPWPEHSNPAASCLQWSCALQAEAVDTFFFFACAHLTRGRCCTSDLIAPPIDDSQFGLLQALASRLIPYPNTARFRPRREPVPAGLNLLPSMDTFDWEKRLSQ